MKYWKRFVTAAAIFLMFFNRLLPTFGGLSQVGVSTLCIFFGTMSLLLFVDLFWPVLLSILAFAVSGVYSFSQAISMTFGHPIYNFCLFSTVLFYELRQSGLLRRMAVWLISRPAARRSPWMFVGSLWAAELIIGSFMNCTVTILLFTTLAEEIFATVGIKKGDRTGSFIMLGLLTFCALSFGITPIGHPTPIVGIGIFSELASVGFLEYSLTGFAVAAVFFVLFIIIMKYGYKLDMSAFKDYDPSVLRSDVRPISRREKLGIVIFAFVVVLWLLPSVIQNTFPELYSFLNGMGTLTPVLLGCIAMCLIRIDGKPMMDLQDALKNGVAWNAAFPIAIAMLLSSAMTNSDAGITEFIAARLGPVFGPMPAIVFVVLICFFCTIMTDYSSDTVTCVLCSTISLAMIRSGVVTGVDPAALCIALGISSGAALGSPAGATYSAVVAGQGWLSRKDQFIHGTTQGVLIAVVASTIGYYIGCFIA